MNGLYKITSNGEGHRNKLSRTEVVSVFYHNIFDYPLSFADLIKWDVSNKYEAGTHKLNILYKNNYYFLNGREGLVYKRALRERISVQKMKIARKAAKILSLVPGIKMVAITGSLAMGNAVDSSDIDLMIITKKRLLWTTRIFAYMVIHAFGLSTRKPNDFRQQDKLCLNMWVDESDLIWRSPRNIYTAHEIAQIIPLVNKDKIYERFLYQNRWIRNFWPNAVRIGSKNQVSGSTNQAERTVIHDTVYLLQSIIEKVALKIQVIYMQKKITNETITTTRAIFHPYDPGKSILTRLHALD